MQFKSVKCAVQRKMGQRTHYDGTRASNHLVSPGCRLGPISRYIALLPALLIGAQANAQQLVINLDAVGVSANAQTANQQLTTSCDQIGTPTGAAQTDLTNTCAQISQLDENDPADARLRGELLGNVAPEEAFSVNDSLVYESSYQTLNIQNRLDSFRLLRFAQSFALKTLSPNNENADQATTSGAGAASDLLSPFGLFVNGSLNSDDNSTDNLQQDADMQGSNITFGGDYRFDNGSVVGGAIGFMNSETSFSRVPGETSTQSVNLSVFGTWNFLDTSFIDAIVDVGQSSYDLSRGIGTTVNNGAVDSASVLALGDTDASRISLSVSVGRYFNFDVWQLSAVARLTSTSATIDAYTETASNTTSAGFSSAASIDEQSVDSTELSVGADISRAISTSAAVVVPFARLELKNESEEDKGGLRAALAASGPSAGYIATDRDTSYANLSLGTTAVFKNGVNAYAMLDTYLGHEFIDRTFLRVGLRLEL